MREQGELGAEEKMRAAPVHEPSVWGYSTIMQELEDHRCPFVECACGWESSPGLRWWEQVGEELDEHIKAMAEARQ